MGKKKKIQIQMSTAMMPLTIIRFKLTINSFLLAVLNLQAALILLLKSKLKSPHELQTSIITPIWALKTLWRTISYTFWRTFIEMKASWNTITTFRKACARCSFSQRSRTASTKSMLVPRWAPPSSLQAAAFLRLETLLVESVALLKLKTRCRSKISFKRSLSLFQTIQRTS